MFNFNFSTDIAIIYGFSILLINIINYLTIFSIILIIILMSNILKFKSLNQFKEFNSFNFILYSIILSLLSMAGIPPLLGFTGKFLIILFLNFKSEYLIIFLTLVINMFAMYFYIQNLRFLVKKSKSKIFKYNGYYLNLNFSLIITIVLLNFFNIFGILFLSDLLIIINCITSFIYI